MELHTVESTWTSESKGVRSAWVFRPLILLGCIKGEQDPLNTGWRDKRKCLMDVHSNNLCVENYTQQGWVFGWYNIWKLYEIVIGVSMKSNLWTGGLFYDVGVGILFIRKIAVAKASTFR